MVINRPNHDLYYIINITAIIIGIIYIIISFKKEKISNKKLIMFMIFFLIVSFVSGKLYSVLIARETTNFFKAGLSSYGGLTGAILFTYIYEKANNIEGTFFKYTVLSLPLIYSLSKFSCFIFGCCHGIHYSGPFSIQYTAIGEETFFPIQLLEIITFMIIFLICNHNRNKKYITYITLALIAIFKFLLDYLRVAHVNKIITHNQLFSILLLIVTLVVFLIKRKKKTA